MGPGYRKISVNLSDEILEVIRAMAERESTTMTEILRRAVSMKNFLDNAELEGKAILLRDPVTNDTERVVFY